MSADTSQLTQYLSNTVKRNLSRDSKHFHHRLEAPGHKIRGRDGGAENAGVENAGAIKYGSRQNRKLSGTIGVSAMGVDHRGDTSPQNSSQICAYGVC